MSEKESSTSEDIALVHSSTDDGQGAKIIRLRNGKIEAAEVRPTKEGEPINHHELVRLHPRENFPLVCDVEVLYAGEKEEEKSADSNRPVRVSTKAYRKNWDRIFSQHEYSDRKKSESDFSVN